MTGYSPCRTEDCARSGLAQATGTTDCFTESDKLPAHL